MRIPQEIVDAYERTWKAGGWEPRLLLRLLHRTQRELHEKAETSPGRIFVACCSRRLGKSFWLCTKGVKGALSKPRSQVRYGAPTAKMVRSIVTPHIRQILQCVPPELRPRFRSQDGLWEFPNGSELHVAGCDNGNAERLRGTATDEALLDEAAFIDDLEYVVQDILLPQTITTGGSLTLASSPPRTPAHDFTKYCKAAEERGAYAHYTIYDAPHLTPELVAEYVAESGGEDTSTWQREYLAKFVVDEESAVVPEFSRYEDELVREWERPPFFDPYVTMDVGFHDMTVAAFGYYDFEKDMDVIEDELVFERTVSGEIDDACIVKELKLWGASPVYMRVVDAPPIVIAELNREKRSWVAARNDDPKAAVNALRVRIGQRRMAIDPRCTTIRAHLRHGIWNRAKTSYERSGTFGHFDGIDAAKYLVRHLDRSRNPFPQFWHGETADTHHLRPAQTLTKDEQVLASLFNRRAG